MEFDTARGERKREQLVTLLIARLGVMATAEADGALREFAERLVDAVSSISPPEKEPLIAELITFSPGGAGGGRSVKLGNVLLDVKRLLVTAAKGTLAVKGVLLAPWTAPFAVLVMWDDLFSRLSIEIDEREASVVWTLWVNRDSEKCVLKERLLDLVNAERAAHGRDPLSPELLEEALKTLCKMRCIQTSKDDLQWRVTEWVSVNFS